MPSSLSKPAREFVKNDLVSAHDREPQHHYVLMIIPLVDKRSRVEALEICI